MVSRSQVIASVTLRRQQMMQYMVLIVHQLAEQRTEKHLKPICLISIRHCTVSLYCVTVAYIRHESHDLSAFAFASKFTPIPSRPIGRGNSGSTVTLLQSTAVFFTVFPWRKIRCTIVPVAGMLNLPRYALNNFCLLYTSPSPRDS